jgi:hypothetical protein
MESRLATHRSHQQVVSVPPTDSLRCISGATTGTDDAAMRQQRGLALLMAHDVTSVDD